MGAARERGGDGAILVVTRVAQSITSEARIRLLNSAPMSSSSYSTGSSGGKGEGSLASPSSSSSPSPSSSSSSSSHPHAASSMLLRGLQSLPSSAASALHLVARDIARLSSLDGVDVEVAEEPSVTGQGGSTPAAQGQAPSTTSSRHRGAAAGADAGMGRHHPASSSSSQPHPLLRILVRVKPGAEFLRHSPYSASELALEATVDDTYPSRPPVVRFLGTPPVHHHVYSSGHVCLDALYSPHWKATSGVFGSVFSVLTMLSAATAEADVKRPPGDADFTRAHPADSDPRTIPWVFHDTIVSDVCVPVRLHASAGGARRGGAGAAGEMEPSSSSSSSYSAFQGAGAGDVTDTYASSGAQKRQREEGGDAAEDGGVASSECGAGTGAGAEAGAGSGATARARGGSGADGNNDDDEYTVDARFIGMVAEAMSAASRGRAPVSSASASASASSSPYPRPMPGRMQRGAGGSSAGSRTQAKRLKLPPGLAFNPGVPRGPGR
jgi:ubiquitin-protein ligase